MPSSCTRPAGRRRADWSALTPCTRSWSAGSRSSGSARSCVHLRRRDSGHRRRLMSATTDPGRSPGDAGAGTPWRLTYVGHATVVITIADTVLVTDPILHRRGAFLRWNAPVQALHDVERCSAALVSHLHADHCDLRSLRMLGVGRTLVVPPDTS